MPESLVIIKIQVSGLADGQRDKFLAACRAAIAELPPAAKGTIETATVNTEPISPATGDKLP